MVVYSFKSVEMNWEAEVEKVQDHSYTGVASSHLWRDSQDLTALPNKLP